MTVQNEIKRSSFPLTRTHLPAFRDTTAGTHWDAPTWRESRYSVRVTDGLMAAIERIPSHCSTDEVQERLWDVLWKASLSARRAKPGCSRIVFEVMLPIEGRTETYQTLILNIRTGETAGLLGMIGFPADFYNARLEVDG
jgi:hypothetical protein